MEGQQRRAGSRGKTGMGEDREQKLKVDYCIIESFSRQRVNHDYHEFDFDLQLTVLPHCQHNTSIMMKGRVSPFFLNREIETFSMRPSTPISLRHLINFGRFGQHGQKNREKEGDKLLRGGNFVRDQYI